MNVVLIEFPFINAIIGPNKLSSALFQAHTVGTLVGSPIYPLFYSITVLFIFEPFALVGGAIPMNIYSFSVSLVIVPKAFINVPICMNKAPFSICHVVLPIALVHGPITPNLLSHSAT